ncbi:MAG: hypothetical protein V9E89_04145 [Ilumatobacteraceae bacterium]
MTRRTIEQTRALLLETAITVMQRVGVSVGVTHIKLNDVAREAGLTTGAAYKCWDNQERFHHDLAVATLAWRARQTIADTVEAIRDLVDCHAPWQEVVHVGTERYLVTSRNDPSFVASIALRSVGSTEHDLAEAARDRLASALASYSELYETMFLVYRRELVAPYTLDHFARTVACLSEGYVLQELSGHAHPTVERRFDDPAIGHTWTLFGCVMEHTVCQMTRPIGTGNGSTG